MEGSTTAQPEPPAAHHWRVQSLGVSGTAAPGSKLAFRCRGPEPGPPKRPRLITP